MWVVSGILSLFYLAFRFGKEDGKWGCFTALVVLFLLGLLASFFD